jgi:hypothetical protein
VATEHHTKPVQALLEAIREHCSGKKTKESGRRRRSRFAIERHHFTEAGR